ncbi:hypothetical protein ACQKNS_22245 [Peribacillus sp. NPDC094092]|uniref:hypothetical protein n=1 Tax=Peribacillus sp. NPDC094092 TaxID=3390611 RepID=UPI003D025876
MYGRVAFEISSEELLKGLLFYKSKQESEIEAIKGKIHKYEQKRRAEEAWYQSLSPFKRFFTGRAPSHHQAVEHLANVKDRYKKIEMIKQKVALLNQVIGLLEAEVETEIREMNLPSDIMKEIMDWQKAEGTPR